jgi:AAA+ ATPase superfamily predicted ATPase
MILIGSDLSVMEMLTSHERPLFGRAREMVVAPFSVGDTARMLQLPTSSAGASAAFDAQLVTGGYPRLVQELHRSGDVERFLDDQFSDDNSELAVMGQRVLDAEFPREMQAADVLRTIGAGERVFSSISGRAGIAHTSLARTLELLAEKRVVAMDMPTSAKPSKLARYRVADPYLRFWLRIVEPGISDIQRGRADIAKNRLKTAWPTYRGRAVEPLVRESLARLAVDDPALGGAEAVGGWWPRTNTPEVDLVGVRPAIAPKAVAFVGSVKWRNNQPFTQSDLDELLNSRVAVPGGEKAPPIAVTRTTCTATGVETYTPDRLLDAW